MNAIDLSTCLPIDAGRATLVGRVWRPAPVSGPSVVVVRDGAVIDITAHMPTMADLLDAEGPVAFLHTVSGEPLGPVQALLANSVSGACDLSTLHVLAPNDLQAVKAAGVTFAVSLLERLIEERADGEAVLAAELRVTLQERLGIDLAKIRPGSAAALALREELIRRSAWTQYLEVGLGVDAEVFTKAQPMSAVGFGAEVGLAHGSKWNNPEPEIVLAVNSRGVPVGATLGNDVNLRDMEGRSALLLGKAKDNNASCAIGPFIRLFDTHFSMDTVRSAAVGLLIEGGDDGFELDGISQMGEISRDPLELVAQAFGGQHQYPDGFMLFLGTMFSPIKDRGEPGTGFTHHLGDRVSIYTPSLGRLVNTVQLSGVAAPWTFGVRALYSSLLRRGNLR